MRLVARHGDYEAASIQSLIAYSRPGTCAIDVGANLGLISVATLRSVPKLTVHSFEPSENTLGYLNHTHASSDLRNRWTIHPTACSDENGSATFMLSTPELGAFDGFSQSGRVPLIRETKVEVVRLDDEWLAWGMPEVSWVKIDVEGSEIKVLKGLTKILAACRPLILTEWNLVNLAGSATDPQEVFKFANEHSLALFDPVTLVSISSIEFIRIMLIRGQDALLMVPRERII